MSIKKSLLAIAVFEVICCSTQAATVKYVDTFGKPMFALNFVNDYARYDEEGHQWSLTEAQRNAIVDAASIWGELFAKNSNNSTYLPISVQLVYEAGNTNNASAGSVLTDGSTFTMLQNGIITGRIVNKNLAEYCINQSTIIGYMPYLYPVPTMQVTQELTTTTFHELSHALGILSNTYTLELLKSQWDDIKNNPDSAGVVKTLRDKGYLDNNNNFNNTLSEDTLKNTGIVGDLSAFASHLKSYWKKNGSEYVIDTSMQNPVGLESLTMLLSNSISTENTSIENPFIVGPRQISGVYFVGDNVSEVLNGALPGVPVNGTEKGMKFDLSHLELAHSMMSHQMWRNYVTLMEAEMAVFQDMGYKIDRRNFYGSSEYRDGQTYTNTNPFYVRNAEGTAYIIGKPNTATLGVGFHLYGSNNTITQGADLLADGRGGTGIRADGSENTIKIPSSTRITANGDHGTGILMSYGKDNKIVSQGTIEATGTGGKAVAFDFGLNMIGDTYESRGSYMRTINEIKSNIISGEVEGYELNLKGPLVSSFDLSGSLEGSYASIYIANNAYVNKINVLKGSSIKGDIISNWNPADDRITAESTTDLYTHLNFGYGVNADGTATDTGDSSFAMTLYGSIQGYESLKVNHAAGTLNINGTVEAYDLTNSGYLAIKGSEDKYSAQIKTNFTTTGTLETGFYADNTSDKIKVGGAANLSGNWVLRPNQDFYSNNARISPEFSVVANAGVTNDFSSVSVAGDFSPTLKMKLTNTSVSTPEVEMYRDSDAYSQYAATRADAEVGSALYEISSVAHGDMQELISSLDFSDLQGKSVTSALKQLGPGAFDYGTMTALRDSTAVTGEMMRHMHGTMLSSRYNNLYNSDTLMASNSYDLNSGIKGVSDRKIIGFVIPYGDFTKQSGTNGLDNMRSYSGGVVMGAECVRNDGVTYGIHGGLSIRNTKVKSENISKIDSQGLFVGLHGSISPEDWGGYYAEGQVKAGWYENQSKRYIDFNNYSQKAKGKYDTYSTGLSLGGGYDFTYGTLSFGPMAYTEYNFIHNQGFTEKRGGGTNLKVKSTNANSLQTTLGGHLLKMWSPSQEIGITADFRTGLKHEFLDDKFHTRASFSDYGSYSFESYTKGAGRNSIFCQSELTLDNRKYNMFASLTLGYEHHNNADIYNVGIKAGLRF